MSESAPEGLSAGGRLGVYVIGAWRGVTAPAAWSGWQTRGNQPSACARDG